MDTLVHKQEFKHPQLDSCFDPYSNLNLIYSVGLDEEVKLINIEAKSTSIIGKHKAPINKIVASSVMNQVVTSGWDREIKFWDVRQTSFNKSLIHSFKSDINVTGIICVGNRVVIAGSTNFTGESDYNLNYHLIKIYDLRNFNNSCGYISYESPLKNETRSICALSAGDGFILGSIEGKIALEYFKELEAKFTNESIKEGKESQEIHKVCTNNSNAIKQSYAFKCHREDIESDNKSVIHAVNALAHNPRYNKLFNNMHI